MRLIIISQTGYALGIASHLSSEGHSIDKFVVTADEPSRVKTIFRDHKIPDIAILDSPEHADTVEWIRSRGIKVLGDSKWSRLLSYNIEYRRSVSEALGYKLAVADTVGVPVVVSCWFNGNKFISKSLVFNYTRFMAGDVGVAVPSAGYVAYFNVEGSRLVNEALMPLEKFLRKANHRGCFSVGVLADRGQWYVQDISASVSQPYTSAVFENTRITKSDVLLRIFNEASDEISYIDPYVCGCMLSIYPYPAAHPKESLEIKGINTFNLKHLWPMDCTKDNDVWTCGSMSGCLGYITARGTTAQEARRRVYRTISNLSIDDIQYRNDIGKDVGGYVYQLRKQKLI